MQILSSSIHRRMGTLLLYTFLNVQARCPQINLENLLSGDFIIQSNIPWEESSWNFGTTQSKTSRTRLKIIQIQLPSNTTLLSMQVLAKAYWEDGSKEWLPCWDSWSSLNSQDSLELHRSIQRHWLQLFNLIRSSYDSIPNTCPVQGFCGPMPTTPP